MTEFDQALGQVRGHGARGLILDLRFNPGGSLRAAVAMVDRFVKSGLIVSTVTRHQAKDLYKARPEGTLVPGVPMVVLINGHSASAAEIVAGSLQDHGRAVIVGARSFGKGVVQNVMELSGHQAAISLTVAHYRLPKGRIIHKTSRNAHTDEWGVLPDVVVEITPEQESAIQERRSRVDRQPVGDTQPALGVTAQSTAGTLSRGLQSARTEVRCSGQAETGDRRQHETRAAVTDLIDDQLAAALDQVRALLAVTGP